MLVSKLTSKDAGLLPTAGTLNQLLQQFGLPVIATYDAKYYKENAQGVLVKERYFPENKLVMFGDENPGESIFGVTPEESRLLSGGTNDYQVGNILQRFMNQILILLEHGQKQLVLHFLAS